MPTRESRLSAFAALAAMLSAIGSAVRLLLRSRGPLAPQRDRELTRSDKPIRGGSAQPARVEAQRQLEGSTPVSRLAPSAGRPGNEGQAVRGEYRIIPISAILPAAAPTRLVYNGVERLVASIAGGDGREGVGLMAPIVVRELEGSRYELIDGARRLRACLLLAERAGREDCLVPAIVYRVSARAARLMQVATLDVPEPAPIELARMYRALGDAIAEQAGHAPTARGLTQVSHHGKTQIAGFLRIGEAISDDVMVAAGLVRGDGHTTPEALVELTNGHLLDAAKGDTVASRAAALKGHLDVMRGRGRASQRRTADAGAQSDSGVGDVRTKERTLSLMARSRTMTPAEASTLIEREIVPAMLALVEQAHGGRNAEGYYSALTAGHACLVLPGEVEGLTLEQLDRLEQSLAMLAARARRAREELQQVDALLAPLPERKTS